MSADLQDKIEIIELSLDENRLSPLKGEYVTDSYYEISVKRRPKAWKIELQLKSLEKPLKKTYKGRLFEEQVEEPRTFAATLNGRQVGWIELGYHKWNNRMRVWELLVKEEFRRKGIGATLMKQAIEVAKQKGARMLILETQSCDVSAIDFYLKQGFDLIGFDSAAYSNDDIEKKEVRLEFGLSL
jgi:GNAT superfamily N-acetyltransferase